LRTVSHTDAHDMREDYLLESSDLAFDTKLDLRSEDKKVKRSDLIIRKSSLHHGRWPISERNTCSFS